MLRKATILFVILCAAGMAFELLGLRETSFGSEKKVLRIGAEGWQITEFKLLEHVAGFRARHPDLRVEIYQLPAGYETSIFLQAGLKDLAYDLIISANNYNIERYYKRKLVIAPVGLAGAGFEAAIVPGLLAGGQVTDQGQTITYLLPFMGEVQTLNYRKDLLVEAGRERPPRTWQEFEEVAEALHTEFHRREGEAHKLYPIGLSLEQGGFFLQNTYLVLLRSLRGSVVDADGHLDMTSPEAAEVFRMVKRWWKKGLIAPASVAPGGAADDFKSGLTAMFPHWQSRGLWALKNEKLAGKIGIAPAPQAHEVGSLVCVYGGVILRGSKVEREAALFMTEVMCGAAEPDLIAAGKMPVRRARYQSAELPEWMRELGPTMDKGYSAPEPMILFDMAEYISVAFHKYLRADSDDPSPMLQEAVLESQRRVWNRPK